MSEYYKELIIELVILRLPVKTLLLFKCVSRYWLRLIESEDFRRLHLQQSKTSSNNLHLFVLRHQRDGPTVMETLASIDAVYPGRRKREVYSQRFRRGYEIVGCCDGVICLYWDVKFRLVLWNAFTRRYIILPRAGVRKIVGGGERFSHGFGRDEVTHDYKVVQIFQSVNDGKLLVTDVKVYSLTSNLWTEVNEFPCGVFQFPKSGCFINGALHWLALMTNESTAEPLVVRFKLGVEKFDLLQVPDFDSLDDLRLGVLGDCLSVCASAEDFCTADIWVAKEGEPWAWIKEYTVVLEDNEAVYPNIRPLTYTDKGKKLLLAAGFKTLLWFDLRDKKYTKCLLENYTTGFEAATCIESLVSLGVHSRADV